LSQPDHETDGQNGPEIFPNYEADRAIRFLRESFVLMHDSEARAQQMLDDAFGDLLGFLPGNFAARMILSAIANCGRDDSINLVGISQCESPRCHCLRCAGHDLALRLFNGDGINALLTLNPFASEKKLSGHFRRTFHLFLPEKTGHDLTD
jgi:hypothetical protein